MSFDKTNFEDYFPSYLTGSQKGRLSEQLKQFKTIQFGKDIVYTEFYNHHYTEKIFLQGDLMREIREPHWDNDKAEFLKSYPDAILISNACDVCGENERDQPKKPLFAPLFKLNDYCNYLKNDKGLTSAQLDSWLDSLKGQKFSNILYLPPCDGIDYFVRLDRTFSFPPTELLEYLVDIKSNRIVTLDTFGHYLMLTKIAFHFCRYPEEDDGRAT